MANQTVSTDQLAKAVTDTLAEYYGLVREDVDAATKTVGKETRKKVRELAKKKNLVRTGKYLKSWRVKYKTGDEKVTATVYAAAPQYRLTHLLEYGHAKVNGGRVPAYPHLAEAEQWAVDEYERLLKEALNA